MLKLLLILFSVLQGCADLGSVHNQVVPDFDGQICTLFFKDSIESSEIICAKKNSALIEKILLKDLKLKCNIGTDCQWFIFNSENLMKYKNHYSCQ